jgi:uncharacterized damage-inducible protein DinB
MRTSDREYIYYWRARSRPVGRTDRLCLYGVPDRMSREEMLRHVITHGIGHRGQVSALMLEVAGEVCVILRRMLDDETEGEGE